VKRNVSHCTVSIVPYARIATAISGAHSFRRSSSIFSMI